MTPTELSTTIETSIRSFLADHTVTTLLYQTSDIQRTNLIKSHLRELGKSLDFHVSASGGAADDPAEWLYDMVWAKMPNRLFIHQAMVMECENKISVARGGEVDDDFQKLVQARADVRVWICPVPNEEIAQTHIQNCKRQIAAFSGTMPDDHYLFVILIYSERTSLVASYQSGRDG